MSATGRTVRISIADIRSRKGDAAAIAVPTIGIGAGPSCDGQILVTEDFLGLFADFKPRFVKRFADLGGQVDAAVTDYVEQVRARRFPDSDHTFVPAPNKQ